MKYTTEEALHEISRRREKIIIKRKHTTCRILSLVVVMLLTAQIWVVTKLPQGVATASRETVYGSFLLSREAGGFVLVALVAFALGVYVTLKCIKYRKQKEGVAKENEN